MIQLVILGLILNSFFGIVNYGFSSIAYAGPDCTNVNDTCGRAFSENNVASQAQNVGHNVVPAVVNSLINGDWIHGTQVTDTDWIGFIDFGYIRGAMNEIFNVTGLSVLSGPISVLMLAIFAILSAQTLLYLVTGRGSEINT